MPTQTAAIAQEAGIMEPIESVSCLICGWNDPNYHELQPYELWCGYYRDTVGQDKADVMPAQYRKWHSVDSDAHPFQHTPRLENGKVSSQAIERRKEVVMIAAEIEEVGISDQEFAVMISSIPKLTSVPLLQIEKAIRYCK
ncbi:hypothetical protein ACQ4M3_05685 [Leptolyngbya sp. AN03gr2]|uniref:hypothetical protein n=1 Tax=unclassified Leptolyngbya TaxID=2650499 RepID=UPI003D31A130